LGRNHGSRRDRNKYGDDKECWFHSSYMTATRAEIIPLSKQLLAASLLTQSAFEIRHPLVGIV
jgi:hypothetical protein